jgi:Carboxypeptidase regulatory-like domain/TonB-dependent Receptor Plug Domain
MFRRLLPLVCLLAVSPLLAQTTGSIGGRATDSSGAALPGVTVEATGRAVQGVRNTITESDGRYRLALLPPGEYTVTFKLEGFAAESRRMVEVKLGSETAVNAALKPSTAGEITVRAEAPVLDTSTTTLGSNLTTRAIETLPLPTRSYASIAQVVPGVSQDANADPLARTSITVYGSSGAENSFFIDGVNTTGIEYGFQGKELNFEFVQEVQVKTGGYEAEYGRSTGGIINVITKSGSNEFHGDVFTYYEPDALQSDSKEVVNTGGAPTAFTKEDVGVDLGGFILRDKLWFFGAWDRLRESRTLSFAGDEQDFDIRNNFGSGKLTYNIAANHSLIATYLQDPRVQTGAISDNFHSLNGDPTTFLGRFDTGGRDAALRYDGVFAGNWVATAQAARHRETNAVGPASDAGDTIQYRDAANDFRQTGGFGLIQTKKFQRKFYGASLDKLFGRHEIKGGIEYEDETADVIKRMSGGQQVDVFTDPVDPTRKIYRHSYWTTPGALVENALPFILFARPGHRNTTIYLQDRWSMDNLTVNFGVRWDRQQIDDAGGITQIDMKKDYAPRLGFIWDPSGSHRRKVYGSYGRYYEQIPMDLVIRSFSYERQPRIINFSPTSTRPDALAEAHFGTPSAILGGFTEPSDPDIKNQYMNEVILGGEQQIGDSLAVGVKGIYRSYGRVVEDFLCADDGTYCIGNPGEGIMKEIFTLDYSQTFPAPKPKRTFKGVQLDATKRFSHRWQAMASYLWSKLDGNYDGEFAPFTNIGADPNISAAYDYYEFFTDGSDLSRITNTGPLSNDRRHQFKVSGLYNTTFGLSVGLAAYWRSGTPLTRMGYSDAYGRYEFFLTRRGAEGRTPDNYEADVHLGYPIPAGPARVNVVLDVFNILNAQRPVLLDQRWGFEEADNAKPRRDGYLAPMLRTGATSARLGVRLSF